MLTDYLTEDSIDLDAAVKTPEEAIIDAGQMLVQQQRVKQAYVQAMIDSYHNLGPYIVIAPNIAMPHAAPGNYVICPCISFIRLSQPICFHHPTNDPVQFIFAVGSSSGHGHIEMLKDLSSFLMSPKNLNMLAEVKTNHELINFLKKGGKGNEGD